MSEATIQAAGTRLLSPRRVRATTTTKTASGDGDDDGQTSNDDKQDERHRQPFGEKTASRPCTRVKSPANASTFATPQKVKGEATFTVMKQPAAVVVVECSNGLVWKAEAATPSLKMSPTKSCATFDDSLSAISVGSNGKAKRGNLPPEYWIQKCPLLDGMLGPIDRRIPLQASNCVDRGRKKGGDNAGADKLQRHLKDFAIAQGL